MESNGNNSAVRRSTSQAELDKALQEEEMEEHLLNELMKVKVGDDQISLDGLIDDLKSKYQDTNTQVEELQTLLDQGDAEKMDQNSAETSSDDSVETKSASATLQVQTDVTKTEDKVKVHVPSVENDGPYKKPSDVVHTGGLPTIIQLEDTVPTATGEQTNSDPPSTTDKDENNVSSDPDIRSDGSLLTSGDKSCLGENSEGVQTCRAEANSAQALNTGVPPGCEVPHSECVDVKRVIPPEHDSTDDGHLPLTSINQSGGNIGQEVNHVKERDKEDITGGFPNNKVEVDPIVVTESSDAVPSKNQQSGKPKTKNKDKAKKTNKVKKQESKKEKKEQEKKNRKVKDNKAEKVKKQEKKKEKKEQGKKTGKDKDKKSVNKEEGKREKNEKGKKTAEKVKDTKTAKVEVMDKEKEADTKGKRPKDEKTKSKKSRRGLLGLFCCCFKGQEIDDRDEIQETEKTRSTARGHSKDASKSSFATIDLDN